jgi:hypothetical protein
MDIAQIVKDAAWLGLACGVIVMGLAMLYLVGRELMQPKVIAAAAMPKPQFGFCLPSLPTGRDGLPGVPSAATWARAAGNRWGAPSLCQSNRSMRP